jgi:dienelactone hydrolase
VKPEKLCLVLEPPEVEIEIARAGEVDVYVPRSDEPPPVVLFVHGPVPARVVRPPSWPLYIAYCRLAASHGLAAATVDLDYVDYSKAADVVPQLEAQIEEVRALPTVDDARVALWAFSGGGLLVDRWLEQALDWLRCVALSYPALNPPGDVTAPVVLTRVGRERPEIQQTVERFLVSVTPVELIDVPNGRHAFDALDDSDESRDAIRRALEAVARLLND